jgi:hypothetical protein
MISWNYDEERSLFLPNISLDVPVLSMIRAMRRLPVVHIVKANRRNRMPVGSKASTGTIGLQRMVKIGEKR